jgi:acetoin utilization deacetylase AcuC-like enzyme
MPPKCNHATRAGAQPVETADYAWLTQQIVALADRHGEGRVVSTLEGGYSHTALAEAGAGHVRALFGLAD